MNEPIAPRFESRESSTKTTKQNEAERRPDVKVSRREANGEFDYDNLPCTD